MLSGNNRVVMISGAARGIGRAALDRLRASGWSISAGVRDPRDLTNSDKLMLHRYDAEDKDSPAAWVAATLERFGAIHALINAAGVNTMARILDEDETALETLFAVNVKGPLRLIRAALPALRQCGQGRVINVASLSGKRVANENFGYAMSKFALIALTQAVRREGWSDGVRATALCPGFVATDMTSGVSTFPREQMTDAADIAALIEVILGLQNTATIGELLVNCRLEPML